MKPRQDADFGTPSYAHALLRRQLHGLLPVHGDYSLVAGLLRATRRDRLNEADDREGRPRIGIVVEGGRCMEDSGRRIHCHESACFVDDCGKYGRSYVTKVPYLSLSLGLDRHVLRRLMLEGKASMHPDFFSADEAASIAGSGIVAAFSRLIHLAGQPEQTPFLAPLIIKEIHYRFLIGPLGEKVRTLTAGSAKTYARGYAPGHAPCWPFRRQ